MYVFRFCFHCFSLYGSNNLSPPSSHSLLVDIISHHLLFFPDAIRRIRMWDSHQGSFVLFSRIAIASTFTYFLCMLGSLVVQLQAASYKTRVKLLADVKGIGRKGEIVFVSPSMYTNVRGSVLLPHMFFFLNFHFRYHLFNQRYCKK